MDNTKPIGKQFYDAASERHMILVEEGSWRGWLAYQHPDGQWASLRVATEEDLAVIEAANKTEVHILCGKKMPHIIDYEDDEGESHPVMRSCFLKLGHESLHKISTPIVDCFITWK